MTEEAIPRSRLEALLLELRVSQRELARRLAGPDASAGVVSTKRRQVSRWCSGKGMSEDSAYAIAEALGVEPRRFYSPRVTGQPVGELEAILDRLLALRPDQMDLLRGEAAELAGAIRRLSEKADLVADRLDALAAPGNGHQADGTSG